MTYIVCSTYTPPSNSIIMHVYIIRVRMRVRVIVTIIISPRRRNYNILYTHAHRLIGF